MRWYRAASVLAGVLLVVPANALAQQQAAQPSAGAYVGPIQQVLDRRTDLSLTAAQVQKLEAIRNASAEQERTLVGKLTEARGGLPPGVPLRTHAATPEERQLLRSKMQAARPYYDQLRQLHQKQILEARALLTADQNARAWVRPHQGLGPRMMGPGRGAGMGRGTGMRRGAAGPGPGGNW